MKHELTPQRKERRIMAVWTSLVLTTALFTTSAFAADSDPLTIVNNLSDFIFSCIKAMTTRTSLMQYIISFLLKIVLQFLIKL